MSSPARPTYHADRFSAAARAYADGWAPVLLPFGRRLLAELPLATAQRVLDIGTGVGSLLPWIRTAAPRAHVVGVDVARGMVALAPRDVDLAVMDTAHLALASATFDAAVMAFVVFFLADPRAALAETRRVLRPGGAVALTSWKGEPRFPAHDVWLAEMRASGAPDVPWSAAVLHPDALRHTLEGAGFTGVGTFLERFDYRHDPSRFVDLRVRLAKPWLDSLPEDERAALVARIRRRLDDLAPHDFVDPTEIIFATARAPDRE